MCGLETKMAMEPYHSARNGAEGVRARGEDGCTGYSQEVLHTNERRDWS